MAPATTLIPAARLTALALKHVGEKYVFGVLVPKDNANWKGPWDCAEFASWLVFQTTGVLYGCERDSGIPSTADAFSGYWERDAKALGQLITLEQAASTPGAFAVRFPAPGAIGHVALSDGKGGTIEAHSTADGVIKGSLANRRWDAAVLVPGYNYKSAAPAAPFPVVRTLRLTTPLMTGPDVAALQKALTAKGFDAGAADGTFGPHTSSAVVAFQLTQGLAPDGEAGPITLAALGL